MQVVALALAAALTQGQVITLPNGQVVHKPTKPLHLATSQEAVLNDCHKIKLDAKEASESVGHGTAYACYTAEKAMYRTLLPFHCFKLLSDNGENLYTLVVLDMDYFKPGLDDYEK